MELLGRILPLLLLLTIAHHSNGQIEKAQLVITSIITEPYLMKSDDSSATGNDKYQGFCKDIADLLQDKLKFQYTLIVVKDNKYGSFQNKSGGTGAWNGMIGELVAAQADLAVAPITISRERASVVDFSSPFIEFQWGVLMRKQDAEVAEEGIGSYIFLRPMSGFLWLVFIVSVVLLVVLLYAVERGVAKKIEYARVARSREPGAGIPPPPALPIGLCANGICGSPRSTAGRFLQVIFWIFVVIFVGAYIATFAADRVVDRLAVDEDSLSIKNVEDLASQDDISPGILRAGSTYDYFRFSQVPFYKNLYTKILKLKDSHHTLVRTMEEGFQKVRNASDNFAFIIESPYAVYENGKQPCNTVLAPQFFGPKKGYGVAMRPEFKYQKEINLALLDMKENGDLEKLEEKWFKARNECVDEQKEASDKTADEHGPLCLGNMAGVFYILLVAIIIAVLIAVVEIVIFKKKNAPKSRSDRAVEVPLRETA